MVAEEFLVERPMGGVWTDIYVDERRGKEFVEGFLGWRLRGWGGHDILEDEWVELGKGVT